MSTLNLENMRAVERAAFAKARAFPEGIDDTGLELAGHAFAACEQLREAAAEIERLTAALSRSLEDPLSDFAHWVDELNTPLVILPEDCPEHERVAARTGFAYACDVIASEITRRRCLAKVGGE